MYTMSIMLSSIFLIPFALLVGVTRLHPHGWQFGNLACKTTLYVLTATAFIKIWLMTLISVDRYLRIVHTHNRYMGRRLSVILTVIAWVLPAATVAGMVYPNSESKVVRDDVTICTVAFEFHPTIRSSLIYFSTIFLVEFFLPATIMILCYILIMRKIKQSSAALRKHAVSNQKGLNTLRASERGLRSNSRRRRTTVILITIVGLFLLSWLPYFVLLAGITLDQILETFQLSSSWIVGQICLLLLFTLIEPFLYSFTTAKVRKELKHTLKSIRPFKPKTTGISVVSSMDDTSTVNYYSNNS